MSEKNSKQQNSFREWIGKLASNQLSQDYKDGWEDGFKAGIRESRNTLSEMEAIAGRTIHEAKKHD